MTVFTSLAIAVDLCLKKKIRRCTKEWYKRRSHYTQKKSYDL